MIIPRTRGDDTKISDIKENGPMETGEILGILLVLQISNTFVQSRNNAALKDLKQPIYTSFDMSISHLFVYFNL